MRVDPRIHEVVYGKRGMLKGIDVVLEAECLVSAVALIFSAIDALAALTRSVGDGDTTKSVFTDWSDKYLSPIETLGCSSTDLYAARCGVLHTYSADSRLGREAKARRLIYEWKAGPSADAAAALPPDSVVVHVEALNKALRRGLRAFIIDAETDAETKQKVEHHVKSMLCYTPWSLEAVVAA